MATHVGNKVTMVREMLNHITAMAQLADKIAATAETYTARGYNGGGSDPITDGDILSETGLTAAQVGVGVNQLSVFKTNFIDNVANKADLAALRNDF